MPARKPTLKSTAASKRPKTSSSTETIQALLNALVTASKLISREAIAATRLQRVWRLKFSLRLTRKIIAAYLKQGAAPTPDYVRSIR